MFPPPAPGANIHWHEIYVTNTGSIDETRIERFPGLHEMQGGRYADALLYFKYPTGKRRLRCSRSCEIGNPVAVSNYAESKTVTANPLGEG